MVVEEKNNNGEESDSASTSALEAEKVARLKFFCSHGGKILPRPSDGTLKYVGGETRAIAVPRSISFSELMNKINALFEGEYILKYQIAKEDLDSLVSVKSDEDVRHMLEEYDRLERTSPSKLRTFIFPVKPILLETHTPLSGLAPFAADQRFLDAVNGIVRHTNTAGRLTSFSPSPTEGSPGSLSPRTNTTVPQNPSLSQENTLISNLQTRLTRVHKVQSSPNLYSLNARHFCPASATATATATANATPYQHYYHQSPDYYGQSRQGYLSPTKVHVRSDYSWVPVMGQQNVMSRGYPGSGGHRRWGHLEQCSNPYGSGHHSPGDLLEF